MNDTTFIREPLREPSKVMRLSQMGAMFPTRLSFLRTLTRTLRDENVNVRRPVWEIDEDGFGRAVYSLTLGGYDYSLVALSNPLDESMRTDRVIAEAWDSAFVLYDGVPDRAELDRLAASAPKQEAARFSEKDLVLSRANRSVRLFNHVVEALQSGQQPDTDLIRKTGYLMRTTAVYGNGKFGIADRAVIVDRPFMAGSFMAEMLTVWLIRGFTHDLVEHVGGAELDRNIKRHLGVGNSTGLGMAPFLVSHPELLSNWMTVRETALAHVRAIGELDTGKTKELLTLADRVSQHLEEWNVDDVDAMARIRTLREEWASLRAELSNLLDQEQPLDQLVRVSDVFSADLQELVVAFVLEPFGDLVDGFTCCMVANNDTPLDPRMPMEKMRLLLRQSWDWVDAFDFEGKPQTAQFWYVSEEKLEPRLGLRYEEPGGDLESPLDIARRVQSLKSDAAGFEGTAGEFLKQFPAHRFAVRRVQINMSFPFSEIRDNLIGENCKPIDMLRSKLALFGASKFDPKSDRWTRITLAQGAPLADELHSHQDWWLPVYGQ